MYYLPLGSTPGPCPTLPTIPVLQQNARIMPIYPSAPFIIQNPSVYRFNSNFHNPLQIMQSRMPRPLPISANFSQNLSSLSQVHPTTPSSRTVDSSSETEDDINLSKVNVKNFKIKMI